jgi:SAM-dependent methyltransferase
VTRWNAVAGDDSGRDYAARMDRAAKRGADAHGEADLVARLAGPGSSVLDAGCGTGRVAIELAARGHRCVGVDVSESMLAVARERAPQLPWHCQDLVELDLGQAFDVVLAAGNVIPLLAAGAESGVVARLAEHLAPGGLLVAGFGLDPAHLPLDEAPVDLPGYDRWCADAGLELEQRWGTWEREPWDGGGYAVSVHRKQLRQR